MSEKPTRRMAQITVERFSRELAQNVRISMLVPEHTSPPFATLYVLHGRGQNVLSLLRDSAIRGLQDAIRF